MIPKCSGCGSDMAFEFQLMPSLLHVLEVDKHTQEYAPDNKGAAVENANCDTIGTDNAQLEQSGQNWGMIGVFSCTASCEASREEVVIVQDTGDGTLEMRDIGPTAVEVQMDDDDDDDDNDGDE